MQVDQLLNETIEKDIKIKIVFMQSFNYYLLSCYNTNLHVPSPP